MAEAPCIEVFDSDSESREGNSSCCMTTDESEGSNQLKSSSDSAGAAGSLLSRLRSPIPSDLARKRRIRQNPPPPKGQKRGTGHVVAEPKNVVPADRAKAYPDEHFTVSNKKLFCSTCREEVATKKSVINAHVKSQKHERGKRRLALNSQRECDIVQALKQFDREFHPEGETLPDSVRVYRVKVVTAMLKAGVPLNKIDSFRDLLEEHAFALTNSTNLRQLLPFILHEEISRLRKEITDRHVSIIFDGTTHVCEAMVIVLRYITDDWIIKQCVCRLMLLAKSMSGEEVARQIISALSTELGIGTHLVVAAMHDQASVNEVAMRTVSVLYNKVMDIGCFSHTLDHVGERMKTPVLDDFSKAWIGLFARSPKSRLAWRTQTGLPPPSFSATRWWSRFEVIHQLHNAFGNVDSFLGSDNMPPATSSKLLDILHDTAKCRKLKMELAITVDAMEPFVKATYVLEGDGPLALVAYERLSTLFSVISTEYYPNVTVVAKELSGGDPVREQQLVAYAKTCVQPAYCYFQTKFDNDLKSALLAFKAARYFSPSKFSELKPTASDIDSLRMLPFLDSTPVIDGLKSELVLYLAAAEDVSSQTDPIAWWKSHEADLPNWAKVCRLMLLVLPSSAESERVFRFCLTLFLPSKNRHSRIIFSYL